MNSVKILSKLKNEQYLNRDHKIVLVILWDQFLSPDLKKCMSPNEIKELGLYKSSKLQLTLKELCDMDLVYNTKGKYQITPKFQFLLGNLTYDQYRNIEDVSDIMNYTGSKTHQYLDDQLITISQKNELLNALKITSNQDKTIFAYFTEWFGQVDGHKKFNELKEYLNDFSLQKT